MSKGAKENEKRYTEEGILTLKATLETRYRVKLLLHRLNNIELFFMCQDNALTKCTFVYIFRKLNGDPLEQDYALVVNNPEHSIECNQTRKAHERYMEPKTPEKDDHLSPQHGSNVHLEEQQLISDSIELDPKHNPQSHSEKQKRATQCQLDSSIEAEEDIQGHYYRQQQLGALKKTLIHKYSALISKSTSIDSTSRVVSRICFRCKNSQKVNCPFLVELNLVPKTDSSPLYQLDAKNIQHTPDCIMDCQDLRYHEMTKKIDDSMESIEKIVRNLGEANNNVVRPKLVLETLAQQLGEENADFIYEGLDSRNNRRAVKKYFDNAVGKIRNKQKTYF